MGKRRIFLSEKRWLVLVVVLRLLLLDEFGKISKVPNGDDDDDDYNLGGSWLMCCNFCFTTILE